MKTNPLGAILLTALFLSSALAVGLAIAFVVMTRDLEKVRGHYFSMNNTLTVVQTMADEIVAYSRTNPAINSILWQYNVKPRPVGLPAAVAPAPTNRPRG